MRTTLITGACLAAAAGLLVWGGTALGLELEGVALLGAALGAAVTMAPDGPLRARLGAFAIGFAIAWVGYAVRAALLPDTSSGRAVAVAVAVVLCTLVSALSGDRLRLWVVLLGTAGVSGAYELTYAAAPPEFLTTSVATASTLFLSVAVGVLAATLAAPRSRPQTGASARPARVAPQGDATDHVALDEMMEHSK